VDFAVMPVSQIDRAYRHAARTRAGTSDLYEKSRNDVDTGCDPTGLNWCDPQHLSDAIADGYRVAHSLTGSSSRSTSLSHHKLMNAPASA
jgi:hypothetical protein